MNRRIEFGSLTNLTGGIKKGRGRVRNWRGWVGGWNNKITCDIESEGEKKRKEKKRGKR